MTDSSWTDIRLGISSDFNDHRPDVRIFTSPRLKRPQLALWLTHPRTEEVEFSKRLCFCFGIAVDWVKTLVVFDEAYNIVLPSGADELLVVRKKFRCRFGDKDVNTALNGVQTNGVVGTWRIKSAMTIYFASPRAKTNCLE